MGAGYNNLRRKKDKAAVPSGTRLGGGGFQLKLA